MNRNKFSFFIKVSHKTPNNFNMNVFSNNENVQERQYVLFIYLFFCFSEAHISFLEE